MKKVFATLTVLAMLTFGSAALMAQEAAAPAEEAAVENVDEAAPAVEEVAEAPAEEAGGMVALHKTLKTKFIEGGAGFMALTLVTLVFGLALCIERIIYLSLSKTNTKELLANIEAALKQGGIEKALDDCRNTRAEEHSPQRCAGEPVEHQLQLAAGDLFQAVTHQRHTEQEQRNTAEQGNDFRNSHGITSFHLYHT